MSDKPKVSEGSKIGLAALIASIGIPLAQLTVGYLQQYTEQQQNAALENEKRRLEITKLFLDNYIGKKSDVQIATIQVMKALDPSFFISIEEGLKETSNSDSVKASIRRATIDAANEVLTDTPKKKSVKVQKVLSSSELEQKGRDALRKGDSKTAQKYFDQAHEEYPVYHSKIVTSSSTIDSKEIEKMRNQMQKELNRDMKKLEKEMNKQ
jgi:hypothetical protein